MKYHVTVIALSFVISIPVVAHTEVIGGPVVWSQNGHAYYLLSHSSWTAAEAEAVTMGGHLVTIDDPAENQWVHETFSYWNDGPYRNLWIGLNDAAEEGTFVWSSGAPVNYTNWHPGEPNGAFSGEDYAHMGWGDDRWIDRRNSDGTIIHGVVEVGTVAVDAVSWSSLKARYR